MGQSLENIARLLAPSRVYQWISYCDPQVDTIFFSGQALNDFTCWRYDLDEIANLFARMSKNLDYRHSCAILLNQPQIKARLKDLASELK